MRFMWQQRDSLAARGQQSLQQKVALERAFGQPRQLQEVPFVASPRDRQPKSTTPTCRSPRPSRKASAASVAASCERFWRDVPEPSLIPTRLCALAVSGQTGLGRRAFQGSDANTGDKPVDASPLRSSLLGLGLLRHFVSCTGEKGDEKRASVST